MEARVYKTGEPITAEFMTDVARSVAKAVEVSTKAGDDAAIAREESAQALSAAGNAAVESSDALRLSTNAKSESQSALAKVIDLETRANNHEFDGKDGTIVEQSGLLAFAIENGELVVYCAGNEAPNLTIDATTGELIYNF